MDNEIYNNCKKILNEGEKFGECEIFVNYSKEKSINIENNNVSVVEDLINFEIGFRIFIDKKEGFVLANKFDDEIVKKAIKIAKISKQKYFDGLPERNRTKYTDVDKKILDSEFDNLKDVLKIFDNKNVLSEATISSGTVNSIILNSNDVECEKEISLLAVEGTCNNNEENKENLSVATAVDNKVERFYFDIKDFFENLKKITIESKNPKKLIDVPEKVIFNQETFSELISMFSENFNAYYVDKCESLLTGKINEKIGNLNLTIIDDPYLEKGLGSTNFDAEGCKTRKNILMENGILKNYAYDWTMSRKFNVIPPGEAVREGANIPSIGFNNLIVDSKEKTNDIFSESNKALYICSMIGMHTADGKTTNFSVKTERAFYIENDKKIPLKPFIITGKFIDLNIIALDKNIENRDGIYVPNMLCKNLKISI